MPYQKRMTSSACALHSFRPDPSPRRNLQNRLGHQRGLRTVGNEVLVSGADHNAVHAVRGQRWHLAWSAVSTSPYRGCSVTLRTASGKAPSGRAALTWARVRESHTVRMSAPTADACGNAKFARMTAYSCSGSPVATCGLTRSNMRRKPIVEKFERRRFDIAVNLP